MKRRHQIALVLGTATLLLGACVSPGYYLQAVSGQLELWRLARPVESIYAELEDGAELRVKLDTALAIRDFASRELGLPDNDSYRQYADLKRPYVVWNVFAADPFSVQAREWCFPVAGCVNYRGYFDKAAAEAFAAELKRQGYEVHIGGVPAYSTLGWFTDSLLNTFIHYPEPELARLMFHELAHQVTYVQDDSEFNESFAVTVEEVGVERWLQQRNDPALEASFEKGRAYRRDFLDLVQKYRQRLAQVYAMPVERSALLQEKARVMAELRAEYEQVRSERWGGFRGYDKWFDGVNNAALASIGIYNGLVPAFQALLARHNGDLPRFYGEVKKLARQPREVRRDILAALMPPKLVQSPQLPPVQGLP
ncbi:MAG: aminopeptidase [Pseudomonadota bacterium]|jgi:predicted aminopeptidase